MGFEWQVIDAIAILVETAASIYFLHKRYVSKYGNPAPELIFGVLVICWGLVVRIASLPGYEIGFMLVMLAYVFFAKHGKQLHKIFGVVFLMAVLFVTSMAGASIAAIIMGVTIRATLDMQDSSRLLAIVFIKMIQVCLLYLLSKKQIHIRDIQKIPVIIIGLITVIVTAFAVMLRVSMQTPYTEQGTMLVWSSLGLLFITIAIFFLYELFVKEESKNANLTLNLQRLELERGFYNEIDAIYKDMRMWRHEYKNNLTALENLVRQGARDEILSYIISISGEPPHFESSLQSGNLVLDSIVNSKLGLAKKHNIEVSIHAFYPKDNLIDANDLCTIVGNLLDNAIEACGLHFHSSEQPSKEKLEKELLNASQNEFEKPFINFEFLVKGKNLTISVQNSFFHEIKQDKGRYVSSKGGLFHGIGLPLLDSVVSKYNGHIIRNHENSVFETYVIIPVIRPGATDEKQTEPGDDSENTAE